jgi:hypothetical protein
MGAPTPVGLIPLNLIFQVIMRYPKFSSQGIELDWWRYMPTLANTSGLLILCWYIGDVNEVSPGLSLPC